MANPLNKNSQYIGSLTDFILDTKPYHSKLTEIVEEYQFFDDMHVHFEERSFVRAKLDPTWLYNYYSGGDPSLRKFPVHQLHSPQKYVNPSNASSVHPGAIRVERDENRDFANIPYVYSKKTFDGPGVAEVLIERNGNRSAVEPLVEGLDWFQSHGSIQLQIKQTGDANTNFVPSWAETRDDNVISTASAVTRQIAHDRHWDQATQTWVQNSPPNPAAAINQIKAVMAEVKAVIDAGPYMLAMPDWNAIMAILAIPRLPDIVLDQDESTVEEALLYESMMNNLVKSNAPPPAGYDAWLGTPGSVIRKISKLTPALYFNTFSDASVRESGQAGYADVSSPALTLSNIRANEQAVAGDAWDVIAQDDNTNVWSVFSGISGYVGSFTATLSGVKFSSSQISFVAKAGLQPKAGDSLRIKNHNRIVFGPTAPRETWNIIKVNPIAYTRPVLHSTRYGFIESATGVQGEITILDDTLPTGTLALDFNGSTFDLTSTIEPNYKGVATPNVLFNDGRISFKLSTGTTAPFTLGDKFYIEVVNDQAYLQDFDLGYGYDLDPYDNQTIVDEHGEPLNFAYDGRFTDYNLSDMNLTIQQNAVSNRKWRLRAIPDTAHPIATKKKDGSGPSNWIDLQDATSGIAPDPALNAHPLYNMPGDTTPNLMLYHANEFALEYSDDGFNTVTSLATVPVGSAYSNAQHGISFTLAEGNKPFVAVRAFDSNGPKVEGGDIFTFTVLNKGPYVSNLPLGLNASTTARLIMHGDGFHEAPAANWTVKFTSPSNFTVTGALTEGSIGSQVDGGPWTGRLNLNGSIAFEGRSFNRGGVHFTVVPGSQGLAAGDYFTFTTHGRKPSYLVHGSVSGWKEDAVVGETYWNGVIGFVIEKPFARLYRNQADAIIYPSADHEWQVGGGTIKLERLRSDAENMIYTLDPSIDPLSGLYTGWYVTRDTVGAVGFMPFNSTFTDQYVTITCAGAMNPESLKLQVISDDFALWNNQDSVIIRPAITSKYPTASDYVLVDKRTTDRLAINLDYDAVANPPSLQNLKPITLDQRFIDLYTGPTGLPLATHSPETAVLRNFLPLTIVPYDSTSSVAEFSDTATSFDVYSAGSGDAIGTMTSSGPTSPAYFEWDLQFYSRYLPLNASANVITYGNGMNDNVNVRIRESVKFLIDSGSLSTDWMFREDVRVNIQEKSSWTIFQSLRETANIEVRDGPFGGFLPGLDNMPLDAERGTTGYYGVGLPLTQHFHEAKALSELTTPTVAQTQRLETLKTMLFGFIDDTIENTSLAFFLAALDAADPINYTPVMTGFGYPAVGMAMDITIGADRADANKQGTEGVGAGIKDALVVLAIDSSNSLDDSGLDIGGLDAEADRTAMIYSGSLPQAMATPTGTYEEFETPLAVVGDPTLPADFTARVFEIAFNITAANKATVIAMPTPQVFIWLPMWPQPQQVAVVDKVAVGRYRVSVPASTEAKLYLKPGT